METPESYESSLETPDKGSPVPQDKVNQDDKEKPTSIRFLVSNAEAGSVIGKGGQTITEFQSESGTRIQLSRNHEYFPGTADRIIMVSGSVSDILTAMELILSKLQNELLEDGDGANSTSKLRLVVPNSACGGIIGKGGTKIKSFIEDSQAGIKISSQDNNFAGTSDRLVTVTGSVEEKLQALYLIVNELVEDPHYLQYVNSPLSYTAADDTEELLTCLNDISGIQWSLFDSFHVQEIKLLGSFFDGMVESSPKHYREQDRKQHSRSSLCP